MKNRLLRPELAMLVITASALVTLLLLILTSPHRLIYDEEGNLTNVYELHRVGWLEALTSPRSISSAGPVFTAIQAGSEPLTQLEPPLIRYPNFFLFLGLIVATGATARSLSLPSPALVASSILCIPFVWTSVGIALTEIPALLFFMAAVWVCVSFPEAEAYSARLIWRASAAGLLLGLACLGRQIYLAALPMLTVLCTRRRANWLAVCLTIFTSIAAAGWLFWLWRGLVPPNLKHIDSGLRWSNGVLSCSYVALATLFVAPRWLLDLSGLEWRLRIPAFALSGFAGLIALAFPFADVAPAKTLTQRLFPPVIFQFYPRLILAAMTALATLWIIKTIVEAWRFQKDKAYVFIVLTLLALALTPIKISHQFSSRYVVGLVPLLLLVVWRSISAIGWADVAAASIGVTLGASVLVTYYRG